MKCASRCGTDSMRKRPLFTLDPVVVSRIRLAPAPFARRAERQADEGARFLMAGSLRLDCLDDRQYWTLVIASGFNI